MLIKLSDVDLDAILAKEENKQTKQKSYVFASASIIAQCVCVCVCVCVHRRQVHA